MPTQSETVKGLGGEKVRHEIDIEGGLRTVLLSTCAGKEQAVATEVCREAGKVNMSVYQRDNRRRGQLVSVWRDNSLRDWGGRYWDNRGNNRQPPEAT